MRLVHLLGDFLSIADLEQHGWNSVNPFAGGEVFFDIGIYEAETDFVGPVRVKAP